MKGSLFIFVLFLSFGHTSFCCKEPNRGSSLGGRDELLEQSQQKKGACTYMRSRLDKGSVFDTIESDNKAGKYHTLECNIDDHPAQIASLLDNGYYESVLKVLLKPTSSIEFSSLKDPSGFVSPQRTIDLRPFEERLCRRAIAMQPSYVRHRGKIGFGIGLLGVGVFKAAYSTMKEHTK